MPRIAKHHALAPAPSARSGQRHTDPPPRPPARRIHVAVIHANLRAARDLGRSLDRREIEVHAFDDLGELRRYINKHADTLDVLIFDPTVPGGEPTDIAEALRCAGCSSALLLTTRNDERRAREIAARVRAEEILLGDASPLELTDAIRRAADVCARRRAPRRSGTPSQPRDELWEAVIDLVIETFERAGLHKFQHRYAIRMRILGMTDEEAAKGRGMKVPSFRRKPTADRLPRRD